MKCSLCGWNESPESLTHLKRTVESCMNTGPCMDRDPVVVWRDESFQVLDPSEVITADDKKKKISADVVIDLVLTRHIALPMTTTTEPELFIEETYEVEEVSSNGTTTEEEITVIPE